MYHTGGRLSLRGEGEQELRRPQDTVGFTPHICKGNRDEDWAAVARADLDRLKSWEALRPLGSMRRCGPVRPGHAVALGEAVDQHPLACPPAGTARAATLARGQKRPPRRPTPSDSSHILPPSRASALAWRPASHHCHRGNQRCVARWEAHCGSHGASHQRHPVIKM